MKYLLAQTPTTVIATAADDSARLIFPFHWRGFERAYTYASISDAMPIIKRRDAAQRWIGEAMDLATFTRWMALLKRLDMADEELTEIEA